MASNQLTLPPEILENIFSHGVSSSDWISLPTSSTQWPWPLLTVNKQWRAVAQNNPDLWRKHEISISRRLSHREAQRVIQHHAKLIYPGPRAPMISMILSCASRLYASEAVAKLIVPNASIIVDLQLQFVPFTALESLINTKFNRIASLEMNFAVWDTEDDIAERFVARRPFYNHNLKNLALYNSRYDDVLLEALLHERSFAWSSLTTLSLSWVDSNQLREVICRCKNLITLTGSNLVDFLHSAPHPPHDGCVAPRLRSVTFKNKLLPPALMHRLPIPWNSLVVLDLGGPLMYINDMLATLQLCPNLQGLSAEVHINREHRGPLNLVQVHLPYLTSLRVDLEDGLLLRCLVVPRLNSLHVNQFDRREFNAPAFVFPFEEIVQMLSQSRCRLVDFQRRRRHFYHEDPPALDFGPSDLLYLPLQQIQGVMMHGLRPDARFFVLSGLVLPRPALEAILMGHILSVVESFECAVQPQDLEIFMKIVENHAQRGRLRYAKAMVPGIRVDHLQHCKHRLRSLSKHYQAQFLVEDPQDALERRQRQHDQGYASDDTDDSTNASDWETDEEGGSRASRRLFGFNYRDT